MSVGERAIYDALKKRHAEFEVEKTFRGFTAPDGQHYTFDFYLPSVEILIECQGHQHYRPGNKTPEELKRFDRNQRRDALKKEWCKRHGYRLICLKSGKFAQAEIDGFLAFCDETVGVRHRTVAFRALIRTIRRLVPDASGIL